MKLSKKSYYALCAITQLGMPTSSERWMRITDIARKTGTPEKFLEQILLSLRHAGLVKSRRGAEGGYALQRPPDQILLRDILDAVEGVPPSSTPSLSPIQQGVAILMTQVDEAFAAALDRFTLRDAVEHAILATGDSQTMQFDI